MAQKLISVIFASNRPKNLAQLLYNLQETCDDPSAIEVLIKIDEGDEAMQYCMEEVPDTYDLQVRFLVSPREDGYYTLHHGYNELWRMSNPETYFILGVSDEVRIVTKGWDTLLRNYIGYFPDHLFRLKLSQQKLRNYYFAYDCGPCPENFSIMTRRWMEFTEGFGDCWGPDVWIQSIDFHLGQMYDTELFRSVPIDVIALAGEEAGRGLSPNTMIVRTRRIYQEWWRIASYDVQQEFRRVAKKMQAYIFAHGQQVSNFSIMEDKKKKLFLLLDHDTQKTMPFFYHLSPFYVWRTRVGQLIRYFRNLGGYNYWPVLAYIVPSGESPNIVVRYAGRVINFAVVGFAFLCSAIPGYESRPRSLSLFVGRWLSGVQRIFLYHFAMKHSNLEDALIHIRKVDVRGAEEEKSFIDKVAAGVDMEQLRAQEVFRNSPHDPSKKTKQQSGWGN
jgi:hypothetical protein